MSNQEKEYHLARWVLSAVIPAQDQGEGSKAYELRINAETSDGAAKVSNPGPGCTRNGYENLDNNASDI